MGLRPPDTFLTCQLLQQYVQTTVQDLMMQPFCLNVYDCGALKDMKGEKGCSKNILLCKLKSKALHIVSMLIKMQFFNLESQDLQGVGGKEKKILCIFGAAQLITLNLKSQYGYTKATIYLKI